MGKLNEIQEQTTQSWGDNSFTTSIKVDTVEFDSLKDSFTFNDEVNVPSLKVNGQEITPSEPQVQTDWNQTTSTESDYILNKPAIKAGQGVNSIVEGDIDNNVAGNYSHAEGWDATASGDYSHTEGYQTQATNSFSHAEGQATKATGSQSHAEGWDATASGPQSHAEGAHTTASGPLSHAEGQSTKAEGVFSHAEGESTKASGDKSHAEGAGSTASGYASHAEGGGTKATGYNSHAEGNGTTASGGNSHAEGNGTTASEAAAHAEGNGTTASGENSHAEGSNTTASGYSSHTEGAGSKASGVYSHAEGVGTTASGMDSHAEGGGTTATGDFSHTEGNGTIANNKCQHVFGEYNGVDPSSALSSARGTYIEIVGNGATSSARSNARTLDWSGNETLQGNLTIGGAITANGVKTNKITITGINPADEYMYSEIIDASSDIALTKVLAGTSSTKTDGYVEILYKATTGVTCSAYIDSADVALTVDGVWHKLEQGCNPDHGVEIHVNNSAPVTGATLEVISKVYYI